MLLRQELNLENQKQKQKRTAKEARRRANRAIILTTKKGDPANECSKKFRDICIAMATAGLRRE